MIYIVQNWLPILLSGFVGTLILGLRLGRGQQSVAYIAAALLASCWLAAILAGALILAPVSAGPWVVALGSAFIIWVGFVLPALVVTLRARSTNWGIALGDAGLWLTAMLAQAAVLRAVGLTSPA